MKDRIPLYPGRVKLNPVAGEANTFDMVRADQPTQEGTALNKENLLSDETAAALGLAGDPTVNDALKKLPNIILDSSDGKIKKVRTEFEKLKSAGNIAAYITTEDGETFTLYAYQDSDMLGVCPFLYSESTKKLYATVKLYKTGNRGLWVLAVARFDVGEDGLKTPKIVFRNKSESGDSTNVVSGFGTYNRFSASVISTNDDIYPIVWGNGLQEVFDLKTETVRDLGIQSNYITNFFATEKIIGALCYTTYSGIQTSLRIYNRDTGEWLTNVQVINDSIYNDRYATIVGEKNGKIIFVMSETHSQNSKISLFSFDAESKTVKKEDDVNFNEQIYQTETLMYNANTAYVAVFTARAVYENALMIDLNTRKFMNVPSNANEELFRVLGGDFEKKAQFKLLQSNELKFCGISSLYSTENLAMWIVEVNKETGAIAWTGIDEGIGELGMPGYRKIINIMGNVPGTCLEHIANEKYVNIFGMLILDIENAELQVIADTPIQISQSMKIPGPLSTYLTYNDSLGYGAGTHIVFVGGPPKEIGAIYRFGGDVDAITPGTIFWKYKVCSNKKILKIVTE